MASRGEKRLHATTPGSPLDAEFGASLFSLDRDVAIKLVGEHAREIDPMVEKRVLRKIDLFLIPAMIVGRFWSTPCFVHGGTDVSRVRTRVL